MFHYFVAYKIIFFNPDFSTKISTFSATSFKVKKKLLPQTTPLVDIGQITLLKLYFPLSSLLKLH